MARERESLLSELRKGKQLADQLKSQHLDPSSSSEHTRLLLEKILRTYTNALSHLDFKRHVDPSQSQERSPKRRRTQKDCAEQAKVFYHPAHDSPHDDGHTWRKYGQKEILGYISPRSYYRCTHSKSKGCLAVKHVQRCDDEPMTVEVTYIGKHTCDLSESSQEEKSFQLQSAIEEKSAYPSDFCYSDEGDEGFSFPLLPIDVGSETSAEFVDRNGSFGEISGATTPATSESGIIGWSSSCVDEFGLSAEDLLAQLDPSEYLADIEGYLDTNQIFLQDDVIYWGALAEE